MAALWAEERVCRGRGGGVRGGGVAAVRHMGSSRDKLPEDEKLLCIKNASEL